MRERELARQLVHVIAGLVFMFILIYLGRINLIAIALLLLFIGSLLINFKLTGKRVPMAHDIGDALERQNVRFPGWGPAWYVFGIILLAIALSEDNEILVGIFILGVSDGIATIIGIHGRYKLPYNKEKTIEGSAAFFITSLIAYLFIGPKIVPLAIITTIIESIRLPIDDNLSLPLVCAAYLLLF